MAPTWPVLASRVRIDSTNNVIRFVEGAATLQATIADGDYFHAAGSAEAGSLLKAVCDALTTASAGGGGTLTYSGTFAPKIAEGGPTGTASITNGGTDWHIVGSHSNTTFDIEFLGFEGGADMTHTDPVESTLSSKCTWVSNQPLMEEFEDAPAADGGTTNFTPSGQDYAFVNSEAVGRRTLELELIVEDRVRNNFATTAAGDRYRALYNWWTYARAKPLRLYHEDETSTGVLDALSSADLLGTYVIPDHLRTPPEMTHDDDRLYKGTMRMRRQVA